MNETAMPATPVPESVQTILSHLVGHKPMTGKEIREATGLPRRTVYTALRRLREMGLLKEVPSLRDTRQTYFWIEGDAPLVTDTANWVPQSA